MTHAEMFESLLTKMREYHPSDDFSLISDAYRFAVCAHGDQLRKNGEPYMIHPCSVALLLADINSDIETITAGILHDVVEDTEQGYEDITNKFGREIADLVKGVTKLMNLQYVSNEEEQAENFRQLFFAMAADIRVILIKMADRLHNLQTLEHMSREHQIKKAEETLDIYAPLAHRLGIAKLRYPLEDLSFRYLKPQEYTDLLLKLETRLSARQKFIDEIIAELTERFSKEGIEAKIIGRSKHLFSIYKKMISQSKSLDEIFDILAVRIIVRTKEDCYKSLGFVHDMYKPVSGRIKDFIAIPKSNNYQSLHTTALCDGKHFEVQIRTEEMERTAEYGVAAHWKYKSRKGGIIDNKSEEEKFAWLRQIIEYMSDNREYLPGLKDEISIYKSHVYCFSPKGEVISLLAGATPIDFAYAIHSAIGNKMVGARVNSNIAPFDYELKNGDQVEIITSNNSRGPSMDWLKTATTAQARSKINQWFRKQNKEENIIKGKLALEKEAERKKTDLHELIGTKKWVEAVFNRYGLRDLEALYAAVGHGGLKEGSIINRLLEEQQKERKLTDLPKIAEEGIKAAEDKNQQSGGILIQGLGGISLRLSKCCRPVPGDEITAYVSRGSGAVIHRTDCANILALSEYDRERLREAEWDMNAQERVYIAGMRCVCGNRRTVLPDIAKSISDIDAVRIMDFSTRGKEGETVINMSLEVKNNDQLEKISVRLRNIKDVYKVTRL